MFFDWRNKNPIQIYTTVLPFIVFALYNPDLHKIQDYFVWWNPTLLLPEVLPWSPRALNFLVSLGAVRHLYVIRGKWYHQ